MKWRCAIPEYFFWGEKIYIFFWTFAFGAPYRRAVKTDLRKIFSKTTFLKYEFEKKKKVPEIQMWLQRL